MGIERLNQVIRNNMKDKLPYNYRERRPLWYYAAITVGVPAVLYLMNQWFPIIVPAK